MARQLVWQTPRTTELFDRSLRPGGLMELIEQFQISGTTWWTWSRPLWGPDVALFGPHTGLFHRGMASVT